MYSVAFRARCQKCHLVPELRASGKRKLILDWFKVDSIEFDTMTRGSSLWRHPVNKTTQPTVHLSIFGATTIPQV